MKIPKHVRQSADAILEQFQLNLRHLTDKEFNKLPDSIKGAVMGLLAPYGWTLSLPVSEEPLTRYLSVAGAELYTSMSKWSLMRAIARKELKCIKLGKAKSSKVLFDRMEIDRWLIARNLGLE